MLVPSGNVSFNTISVNGRYELFSIVKVKVLESLLQYMPEGGAILVKDKEYGQEQPSLNLLAGVCVSICEVQPAIGLTENRLFCSGLIPSAEDPKPYNEDLGSNTKPARCVTFFGSILPNGVTIPRLELSKSRLILSIDPLLVGGAPSF